MYLAIPEVLPKINDYYGGMKTQDRLYRLNLNDLEDYILVNNFSDSQLVVDIRDMFLAPADKLLYFRDNYDDSIFVVNLKKIFDIEEVMEL